MKQFGWLLLLAATSIVAQEKVKEPGKTDASKFRQMYDLMATPNMYRTASGAPGPEYYQQQADYKMDIEIDDRNAKLFGTETITYTNNAKESLEFLWLQLDQNLYARNSQSPLADSNEMEGSTTARRFTNEYLKERFDGGFNIDYIKDASGKPLSYTINQTMMRVDLPKPLAHGEKFSFTIKWWYNITNYLEIGGRSGYEYFPEDKNRIYVIAQFFPRMAVYNDVEGWQNMQFWGAGEFALPFGNYEVNITVPADHVMEATGALQNPSEVFTPEQYKRYLEAQKSYDKPVIVVTQAEATAAEKGFSEKKKTWRFKADNVRDFGISTSRKYIYDAMAVKIGDKNVMAITLYPKEGNPLWGEYATRVVAHTLKSYSSYTFDYPYPKAVAVNAKDQGMEYPMICWNWGRPDTKGKYDDRTKYGMMEVVIHEVGHNFFPMIVNSDERQWTWMDEGLNSFIEYLAEMTWDPKFPSRRGPAKNITAYMSGSQDNLEPIMSNSEVLRQFGNNAYGKPAAGLNMLREVIMGHELFDHAFRVYCNRWKFKHPTPEDFFRTMEDASGVDLDWFWRGWFYTTDYNDIGIKEVKQFYVTAEAPKNASTPKKGEQRVYMVAEGSEGFNDNLKKPLDLASVKPLNDYLTENFSKEERAKLANPKYFYQVTFDKPGGLVMPILVELTFDDGTTESHQFPAQIWRFDDKQVSRVFATGKKVTKIEVDPKQLTADIDTTNNTWPKSAVKSKFD
ncbi:Aminopeptidase, family M1 [Flavobacterium longum]|uniref:M1 family metallopeptidase n=1 Tax=Flavobacterium longum TaxID=1299340 RepID=UPI0039E83EF7